MVTAASIAQFRTKRDVVWRLLSLLLHVLQAAYCCCGSLTSVTHVTFFCYFCTLTGVEPGFAAVSDKAQVYLTGAPAGSIIAAAKPCPQDHYCTGGSPFDGGAGVPTRCPGGLRTQYEGAFSADQCGELQPWLTLQRPLQVLFACWPRHSCYGSA